MGKYSHVKCNNCYFGEDNAIGISTHEYSFAEIRKSTFNVETTPIQINDDNKMPLIEIDNTFLKKYNHIVLNLGYCSYNPGCGPINI